MRSCVVGIFTCGTFEIPLVYTVPRVRREYTRQLPPAHAMRCLIFKFCATPVPSLISEIGQGWKNQVQHRRRAGLWANLLIVSLTQLKPHANLYPVPIQPTQTEARRRAHAFSLRMCAIRPLRSDATRNQSTTHCHVLLCARSFAYEAPAYSMTLGEQKAST